MSLDKKTNVYFEKVEPGFTGTWGMLKLWRVWMKETAEFMKSNGVVMPDYIDGNGKSHGKREFRADDAHELFTARWMGVDNNGRRYSWALRSKNPDLMPAPKEKRLYAMDKHQDWAIERGLKLFNPEKSELRELTMRQEQ